MNKLQRGPWVALTESGYILCSHCRSSECHEDYCECHHPLEAVNNPLNGLNMEPGDDCFGFRPEKGLTLEEARSKASLEDDDVV